MSVSVICDGCGSLFGANALVFVFEAGHIVRYCRDCAEIWHGFEAAQQAKAAEYQRLLELWQEEARAKLPLNLVPMDLPPVKRDPQGRPLILG